MCRKWSHTRKASEKSRNPSKAGSVSAVEALCSVARGESVSRAEWEGNKVDVEEEGATCKSRQIQTDGQKDRKGEGRHEWQTRRKREQRFE